ncbi:MAG TPA: TetR/AcrR family transcriptional regulator [Anaerolineaceae bacterium]|nr:TetR/AcrR family transcriptional regulator [Anaerolineaceae bacterium]
MSKKDTQDMRVRRTRKWLQEALLSLMLEKPFTKIAITEITDQAEVSRPTFYLHYRNKEEVLEDYLDSMYRDFMVDMQPYLDSIIQGKMAVKLFEQIANQAVFLRSLIDSEVSYLVMNKLYKYCYDVIRSSLKQAAFPVIVDTTWDFVIASIAGSVYAMSVRWLEMDMPLSPKEMGELTMRLIRPGVREVLMIDQG